MSHIFSDGYIFVVFQGMLILAVIYAYLRDMMARRRKSAFTPEVLRGNISMEKLGSAFAGTVLIVLQINAMYFAQEANALRAFSVVINMLDVLCIAWLCFRSISSRNWILDQFHRATVEKDH